HPIRAAHILRNFDGRPIYCNVSGNLIEMVGLDFSSRGINVVKRPVIRCPGYPVGNGHLWNLLGHSPVLVDTIKACCTCRNVQSHGTDPYPTLTVAGPVVTAVVGQIWLQMNKPLKLLRLQIEAGYAPIQS